MVELHAPGKYFLRHLSSSPLSRVITREEHLEKMGKLERVRFATALPGPKPICLVGTRSAEGIANLAPFSSITHLGSNPILIGMVTRPDTVERHTLRNILATKSWTLNPVTACTVEQAHQCSARYSADVSEFASTSLDTYFSITEHCRLPYPKPHSVSSGPPAST